MSQAGRGGRGPGGNTGSSSGPGGGSGGSSGSGNSSGSTGGGTDGRGSNTPGAPDGNGRGRTGSGATGGPGTDTPGAPNAPDGKRGSTMGPDGGSATGGRDGRGTNTPSSPAARARDAMDRRARNSEQARSREGLVSDDSDLGIGEGYSHPDAIAERAKTGMVSPKEADMARGYNAGKRSAMAEQSVGAMMGSIASQATGIPGVSKAAKTGVGKAAEGTVSSPEAGYGVSVARNRAKNSMVQSAAQAGATVVGGPMAGMAVGMANTAINDRKTSDIDRMSDAMGIKSQDSSVQGSGNGGMISQSQPAQAPAAPATKSQNFSWNPVDMNKYSRGLLSLAQSS